MATPAQLAINITQGADYSLQLQLKSGPASSLVPVDLTGSTCKLEVRAKAADYEPSVLLTASTTDGRIVLTDPAQGVLTITIPGAATSLPGMIPVNNAAVWDLAVTLASGARVTMVGGKVTFTRRVTA